MMLLIDVLIGVLCRGLLLLLLRRCGRGGSRNGCLFACDGRRTVLMSVTVFSAHLLFHGVDARTEHVRCLLSPFSGP